ncbi:MAG: TSUP family transporter [Candidatus Fermentibacteraceae bacterium]
MAARHGLGVLAAFNKGLPGFRSRSSVAIASLAESFTCLVGVVTYLALGGGADWKPAPVLVVGAVLSAPVAAWTVRRLRVDKFTTVVGAATAVLGALTIYKALM